MFSFKRSSGYCFLDEGRIDNLMPQFLEYRLVQFGLRGAMNFFSSSIRRFAFDVVIFRFGWGFKVTFVSEPFGLV